MGKYFGTDGFRGEANVTLTVEHAYKVGRFLGWYYGQKTPGEKCRIVIGKDTRRSSYMFEYSLVAGLTASGADVYLLHVTTTPSVSYVVRTEDFHCGIMISASHNPYYDNGIKVIDGTENNETALTTGKHGEICKVYSTDQHAMIPDVMVMSEKVWKNISPEDQQIILEAARESTEQHKIAWDAAIDQAIEEAKTTMGVEFVNDVDKEAFREATSGMISDYCEQYPGVKKLLDIIDSVE